MNNSQVDSQTTEQREWPDELRAPEPAGVQQTLALFWQTLDELPDLLARGEHLLAEDLTARLRGLVLDMMLALNGIQRPRETRHLNSYLGESQRRAIEKTLVGLSVRSGTWSARAVALVVIYRWYAPQLVAKYELDYPQSLEDAVLARLQAQIPNWPTRIETDEA